MRRSAPTNIELSPDVVRKDLTNEQYRLYRLIWGRFTACQMANAVYDNVVVDVDSAGYVFRANYSEMRFAGYTAVYEEGKDEESDEPRSKRRLLKRVSRYSSKKCSPSSSSLSPLHGIPRLRSSAQWRKRASVALQPMLRLYRR